MTKALTVIPLLLTALSIFFGATQYARTQQQEFRKRYWEAQFTLYTQAAEAAASIANAGKLEEVDAERKKFWRLYWGPLSAIEHPEVEDAMKRYGQVLGACEEDRKRSCFTPFPGTAHTELREASYNLAHCIRASLAMTWRPVDIGGKSHCKEARTSPPPPPWWRQWLGLS